MDPHRLPDLDEMETRVRQLISAEDLPQPDAVEKDTAMGELAFLWHDRRLVVVIGPDGELTSGSAEPPSGRASSAADEDPALSDD